MPAPTEPRTSSTTAPGRSLEGRVALVTCDGAGHPLALEVAGALRAAGATAVVAGPAALSGGHPEELALDVLRDVGEAGCRWALEAAEARYGRLDALCHLAGTAPEPPPALPLHEVDEGAWDGACGATIRSALLVSRHAVPLLRRSGGGSIVTLGHAAALVGIPGTALLAATTGALLNMTRAMALQGQPDGIRVNCVLGRTGAGPGPTAGTAGLAPLIVFLSGPGAAHITGQTIAADGGLTAWR